MFPSPTEINDTDYREDMIQCITCKLLFDPQVKLWNENQVYKGKNDPPGGLQLKLNVVPGP